MPWLAAATVAAPILGGLVGNIMSQGDKNKQRAAMKDAYHQLELLGTPPDLSKALILKEFQKQGVYTPELEQEIQVAQSEYQNMQVDQTGREAQLKALGQISNLGKVGLGAEDRAALNQARSETQRDMQGKQAQIAQLMQSRGMGGSGSELMQMLQNAQGGAEIASQQSDRLMANASTARRDALAQMASQAGALRNADYGQASDKARAMDERNRMIAANSVARQSANVGSLNQAQQLQLAEQQRIADANTQQANAEAQRQSNEQGAFYDRKAGLAGMKASALNGQAAQYGNQAAQTAGQYAGIGSAVGAGVSAYGQNQQNQANSQQYAAANNLVQDETGKWVKKA